MIDRHDNLPIVLVGAGGHAQVLIGLIRQCGWQILGVCDVSLARSGCQTWENIPVLGDDTFFERARPGEFGLVNAIGFVPGNVRRREVQTRIDALEHFQPVLVHPRAFVDPSVKIAPSVQVMAGAVIQPEVRLGSGAVINTGATVDHHGNIGAGVHVAPGAIICGNVSIGRHSFIGAGSVIAQGCVLGDLSVVAAGTTVVKDIPSGGFIRGPAPLMFTEYHETI